MNTKWKQGEDREYYSDGSQAFSTNSTGAAILGKCYPNANNNNNERLTNSQAYSASYLTKSTYYLSTGIDRTTDASSLQIASYSQLPAEDEAILNELGVSDTKERLINFIFNERTRELLGEWNRWEELARTGLLVKRAKAFNPEAAPNVQDRHMYRPIPQKFIDTLQNEDGTNLSDAEKKAWQNPGY